MRACTDGQWMRRGFLYLVAIMDWHTRMDQISIPGVVTAIACGFGVTGPIFAKWSAK